MKILCEKCQRTCKDELDPGNLKFCSRYLAREDAINLCLTCEKNEMCGEHRQRGRVTSCSVYERQPTDCDKCRHTDICRWFAEVKDVGGRIAQHKENCIPSFISMKWSFTCDKFEETEHENNK